MKAQADPLFQILQVNLQSDRGGDGRIVSDLHERYRALGYRASVLVGRGTVTAEGEDVLPNDAYRSRWARAWLALAQRIPGQGVPSSKIAKSSSWIAELTRRRRIRNGFEDFEFPATLPVISQIIRERPTILHLHNLHGGYFDLRALPALSDLTPVVLTLHDQWAFTGHCAHSFGCERWRSGCGNCPDLTIYPGIPKDRTAENFTLKQQIFSRTRLYLTYALQVADGQGGTVLACTRDRGGTGHPQRSGHHRVPSGRQGSREIPTWTPTRFADPALRWIGSPF